MLKCPFLSFRVVNLYKDEPNLCEVLPPLFNYNALMIIFSLNEKILGCFLLSLLSCRHTQHHRFVLSKDLKLSGVSTLMRRLHCFIFLSHSSSGNFFFFFFSYFHYVCIFLRNSQLHFLTITNISKYFGNELQYFIILGLCIRLTGGLLELSPKIPFVKSKKKILITSEFFYRVV